MKKREVAGDAGGADWPTQPPKKLKTEEMTLPAAQPEDVNNYGWRGDTSKMFSCRLCQYHTPDEEQIMEHFNSSEHKDILKHLVIFFTQHRLDFLQEYFLYVKEEMSMQQKNSDMPPIRDKFKGIGQEHYLHRIQAAHCRACKVLIPDVPELLTAHITSPTHKENCKTTFRTIKINSYAIAKELFLDEKILQILKKYLQKQKPIKEIVACLSQVNSTDVLVAEEDDDSSDEDGIADPVVPCDRNEDSIAEAKADPEVPGNHNEGSIAEAKAHPEVPATHNEGSITEAKADPEVPGNHNEGSIAEAKAHPEVPATHKEHAVADAKAHPEVPGNRNEDVIGVEKVDAKVPVIHKQGPAHENKGHPGSNVPCPPMNIPKNMPSSSMVNPQLIPRFKMTGPYFPTYNRFRVQNDFQFAENFDLDEDAFLVGSYSLDFTKNKGPTYIYHAKQKGMPPLLHQGGKKKNKARHAKKQQKQQVINRPQSSGAAAKNQQKQQVINRPQSSGAAAKNQQKQQVLNQPQSSGAAAKNQQKQQVFNQPQSSGAAAKNQQKQQVMNRPQSSGAPTAAAKNPQKQQVINQPQSSGVRAGQNPQQPTPPAVCHPASSKTQTKTQIGDMKKSEAAGKNSGATGSTPPNQKLNTSNPSQFKETPKNVKNDRWRVGLSHMYSCGLCEYRTPDDNLIQTHVNCFLHKQIRSYLGNYFTRRKVDFLNKYIVYKGRKTAMQRKMLNIQSLDDKCAGLGDQHFLHRVQVVHCQACDVLIPDVRAHYASHIQLYDHRMKRKAMAKDIRLNSLAVAKRLFQDFEVCGLLKAYELGKDPFQHLPVCESQVSSTGEVQAADVDINDEDKIADSDDDSEVPAHETQGSHNKKFPPVEPKMIVPATSSTTLNIGGAVQEEEEEEEDMAAEAP
ncbi:uncharacterized protein [Eleutherodactylus coqui]|uniref:uncharacterized protein isoform X6 n=1 Tax=Eleutherodactylus coqui TaxID=57060 RepID=UPI003462B5F0